MNDGWNEWTLSVISTSFAHFDVMKYKNDVLVLKCWLRMKETFLRVLKMECCLSMKKKIMQGGVLSNFLLDISRYASSEISPSRQLNKLTETKQHKWVHEIFQRCISRYTQIVYEDASSDHILFNMGQISEKKNEVWYDFGCIRICIFGRTKGIFEFLEVWDARIRV